MIEINRILRPSFIRQNHTKENVCDAFHFDMLKLNKHMKYNVQVITK